MSQKSWCKVASNLDSHPKIRRAGRNAREVFMFALRRNAEPNNPVAGMLPGSVLEPWYLADQLMMTEPEAIEGLERAEMVGLLRREGAGWAIGGWDEDWGKLPSSNAERQRKHREKHAPESKAAVTVTESNGAVVTDRDSNGSNALDQIRLEEIRDLFVPSADAGDSGNSDTPGIQPTDPEPPKQPKSQAERDEEKAGRCHERAWKAADRFRELVLEQQPGHAMRNKPWSGHTGSRLSWAYSLHLLVTADGRSWEDLHDVLQWLFKRQTAGKHNFVVQSPDSLREKWDRIAQFRANNGGPKQVSRREPTPDTPPELSGFAKLALGGAP